MESITISQPCNESPFGKPSAVTGECSMTWNIKPVSKGGPQRYASFQATTDDDTVYFTIGAEQGP